MFQKKAFQLFRSTRLVTFAQWPWPRMNGKHEWRETSFFEALKAKTTFPIQGSN